MRNSQLVRVENSAGWTLGQVSVYDGCRWLCPQVAMLERVETRLQQVGLAPLAQGMRLRPWRARLHAHACCVCPTQHWNIHTAAIPHEACSVEDTVVVHTRWCITPIVEPKA